MRAQFEDLKNSVEEILGKQKVPQTALKANWENDLEEEILLLKKENESLQIELRQKELIIESMPCLDTQLSFSSAILKNLRPWQDKDGF